jgi:outer membrane protein OmpA-like peptidoglycan-associated protein
MNKKLILIFSIIFFVSKSLLAQIYQDSWNFGFGFSYPSFFSTSLSSNKNNYGLYLCIQRNISEHVGLRFLGDYNHMEGDLNGITQKTDLGSAKLGLLYYLVPCEKLTPYFMFGFGGDYIKVDKQLSANLSNKSFFGYQFDVGLGAEYKLSEDWNFQLEFDYLTTSGSKLDGIQNESNDAYLNLNIGLLYYLDKGQPSRICDLCDGISTKPEKVDYEKIESLIKKFEAKPAKEIDYKKIEDIVKRYNTEVTFPPERWVLLGVNFNYNSAHLKPESYPTLDDATKVLILNTDLKIEIQGYTDILGSEERNQKLSLDRAVAVMNYLIAKGVKADRLKAVGLGEKNPVGDNKKESGRKLNRRIEFKIVNE